MKKTRELIQENLKLVDLVLEIVDARIPVSSRNPIIDELVKGKRRIILLNKRDLADEDESLRWLEALRGDATDALLLNSMSGDGVRALLRLMTALQDERNAGAVRKKPLRAMIVGVPNVGKSSLINRLTGKKSARTGDRPGVTRGKQWLTLENGMQLLDTPGILWPKFEDPETGRALAFCGSIKDEIMDMEGVALELLKALADSYPRLLEARYKLTLQPPEAAVAVAIAVAAAASAESSYVSADASSAADIEGCSKEGLEGSGMMDKLGIMEAIAAKRGFIKHGGKVDYERTARTVLDEFRSGLIGRITLEKA
jgi:ribosome biogenesis GTPase A